MRPLLAPDPRRRELDVVGIGEISLDWVAQVERFPTLGEKLPLLASERLPGGQMATTLRACARLGLRAALVGRVGDDEAGTLALAPLRKDGIDLAGVERVPGAETRFAWILVERASGERTVLWRRDPALRIEPGDLRREQIVRGRALHLDATDPEAALWAAGVAREEGIPVFLDADRDAPGVRRLVAAVDFPIVSQHLARALAGGADERDALRVLAEGRARYAVVTLGKSGALAGDPEAPIREPAFPVEVCDTTGAGDVFHAAFLCAALEGRSGPEAVRFGNAAAALNCTGLGAQGALPRREEVEALLATAA